MSSDEEYVRKALDIAEQAADNGNIPFGSLLVVDDEVVATAENTSLTDDDITAHPEFKLARRAWMELDEDERANCTMYTSTEPCAMCAGAIYYAGLNRVVFSASGGSFAQETGFPAIDLSCEEIFDRSDEPSPTADGPLLETEGMDIHRDFDYSW
jgi:tRNA(Arg) A34 adenosine deaminase TadA